MNIVKGSGCQPFVGVIHQLAHKHQAFLNHRSALPFTFQADHPVILDVDQDIETFLDILCIDTFTDGALADCNPGQLTPQRCCQGLAHVFNVDVADLVLELFQEGHRVLPGNVGVSRIHIHAQDTGCRQKPAFSP